MEQGRVHEELLVVELDDGRAVIRGQVRSENEGRENCMSAEAERAKERLERTTGTPARRPGAVLEPRLEEGGGIVPGQGAGVAVPQVDELAYVVEGNAPTPGRVEIFDALAADVRRGVEAEPLEDSLESIFETAKLIYITLNT